MYYTAGYYLIVPKHERGTVYGYPYMSRAWSVSTYVSHVYPEVWGFKEEYSRRQLPKDFKPTDQELADIHTWIGDAFENNRYGWPGFFFTLEKAVEFKTLFLHSVPQVQVAGIFLNEMHCPAALEQVRSYSGPKWPNLTMLLQQGIMEPGSGSEIGFDLLGLMKFGGYEPFSFHVPEEVYLAEFGIELNEYGLFTNETDCYRIASYTDTVADEPAAWLPFKVKLFTK